MSKVLFVELLGGVGDLVIALPAIHALALSHPGAEMTVLTFPPGADLLAADPLVHRVVQAARGDRAHPDRPRLALEDLLAAERFDLIVTDTTYAGIAERVRAAPGRVVADMWRRPPADQLIEERFLQILAADGEIESWTLGLRPRLALDAGDRLWAAAHFAAPGRRVLLHPHAGMAIKAWPRQSFIRLGRALREGYGVQLVIPEGLGPEVAVSREIAAALGPDTLLLPAGSLRHLAAAAAHADLVIGVDTGPVRVAAAVGALTLTLFGPSWHGRYGQRAPNLNLQAFAGCPERVPSDFTRQACWYAGSCPLGPWRTCLEEITVGDVLQAAGALMRMTAWWGKPAAQVAIDAG